MEEKKKDGISAVTLATIAAVINLISTIIELMITLMKI